MPWRNDLRSCNRFADYKPFHRARSSRSPSYHRDARSHQQQHHLLLAVLEVLQGPLRQCRVNVHTYAAHSATELLLKMRTTSPTQPEVVPVVESCKSCGTAALAVFSTWKPRQMGGFVGVRTFPPQEYEGTNSWDGDTSKFDGANHFFSDPISSPKGLGQGLVPSWCFAWPPNWNEA